MFGFVTANLSELTPEEKQRYNAVYCGICRQIRFRASNLSRIGLQFDMAFLALLLMSLYEPAETSGDKACMLHPVHPRPWIDNELIGYCADMNVALAYYKALDDWHDDRNLTAKAASRIFGKRYADIESRYPRQCQTIARCIAQLRQLEQQNCDNPDEPAGIFGELMAELLCYREDIWADILGEMGFFLGRFIYLADAAMDYEQDQHKHKYNPFLAMASATSPQQREQFLVLAMARCTQAYEKLPLVQDKSLLDNILYSGIWLAFRKKQTEQSAPGGT